MSQLNKLAGKEFQVEGVIPCCRMHVQVHHYAVMLTASFLASVNSRSRSLYAIARPSVVCLSSVTVVLPTQAVPIFGNISTALGTLAIH